MKRTFLLNLLTGLCWMILGCGEDECEGAIEYLDGALESIIRDEIGKPTGDIYSKDLEEITKLEAMGYVGSFYPGPSISDLTGIECLSNLQEADLRYNLITDLDPLSDLTDLVTLDLYGNYEISDIRALSGLTNLRSLSLSSRQISDISSLSGLTSLEILHLVGRPSGSPLIDISVLSGLINLKELNLRGNQISDISALSSLTSLRELDLNENQISDLGPLVANAGLGSGDVLSIRINNYDCDDPDVLSDIDELESRGFADFTHDCQ
jgi:Leucine-rich repeat (LRR) protein